MLLSYLRRFRAFLFGTCFSFNSSEKLHNLRPTTSDFHGTGAQGSRVPSTSTQIQDKIPKLQSQQQLSSRYVASFDFPENDYYEVDDVFARNTTDSTASASTAASAYRDVRYEDMDEEELVKQIAQHPERQSAVDRPSAIEMSSRPSSQGSARLSSRSTSSSVLSSISPQAQVSAQPVSAPIRNPVHQTQA